MRYFLAFLILALFSCKKDPKPTVINGTIIDKVTGVALDSVRVEFSITHYGQDGHTGYEKKILYTDLSGKFSFIESEGLNFYINLVTKPGYLQKLSSVVLNYKKGENNEVTIRLIPTDAIFRLSAQNIIAGVDSIYIAANSPLFKLETPLSKGTLYFRKFVLPAGSESHIDWPVASNEKISIFWNDKPLPADLNASQFRDSIFIAPNDTTSYTILF